jgi:hypothetical protein
VARAAAPFWKQYGLVDLKVRDAALHARLLAAIVDLDLACAAENDRQIAAAGAGLVAAWHAVAAVMKIEEAANRERGGPHKGHGRTLTFRTLLRENTEDDLRRYALPAVARKSH